MTSVISCPSCEQRNRLPTVASGRPRCASCRTPLPWLVDADDEAFDGAVQGPGLVLVDLWAPWCGPCRTIAPALAELAAGRAGRLKVVKVNVDENPRTSARYEVSSIPMLLLFRDGRLLDRIVGAQPAAAIERWLDRHPS